ncbi:hypothetical protein A2U01_0107239, partial [Trifolium medium]|nr:hypothetical protein [Trifolium medium]
MVISGGGFNKITIGSVKRKFDELMGQSSNMSAPSTRQSANPYLWHSISRSSPEDQQTPTSLSS